MTVLIVASTRPMIPRKFVSSASRTEIRSAGASEHSSLPSDTILLEMLATIVAIALLAFIIRRVYFHPLSKIPGPKLAALTSLYYTFHEFRGDRHFFIDKLHRKYGHVVRIGPSYVSCADPAAVKEIYGVGSWDKPRGGWYSHFSAYGEENMFSSWEGKEHLRRKKVGPHKIGKF